MTDELIEELARAMQDQPDMSAWEDLDEGDQDHMLSLARAILPIIKRREIEAGEKALNAAVKSCMDNEDLDRTGIIASDIMRLDIEEIING